MANKLSTIIDRCATDVAPLRFGEETRRKESEPMRHFTLHCNTFRATY